MRIPRAIYLACLGAIVAAGTTDLWWRQDGRASPPPATVPAVPVSIGMATSADVPLVASGLGTVQATNTVTVRTRVDGQLMRLHFTEGQLVKAGDLLAEIDPRPFQAALDQALGKLAQDEAALANARLVLGRDSDLAGKQFVSQQVLDTQRSAVRQLEAAVQQDQAAIDSARTQLSYTRIDSPIDGRTGIRLVDPGNILHATDAGGIVVVTQVQPMTVLSTLPEQRLPAVRKALDEGPVTVVAQSRDGASDLDRGTLSLVDNRIDTASGTVRLKSTFPNANGSLWPGQFVLLQVTTGLARRAVVVPSGAIQRGPQGPFVYVVGTDEKAEARPVSLGQVADERAIVESGLAAGERVITAGQYRVAPGSPVRAAPAAAKNG